MTDLEKQKLLARNKQIIHIVQEKIKKECPNTVDLIGIGGSFCNGDFYLKSDLDLVIVINSKLAKKIDKCFILEKIGYDIYTRDWQSLKDMANYDNPYVTKLFDLDIVYVQDKSILTKYNELQEKLKKNMQNTDLINQKVTSFFSKILNCYEKIKVCQDIGDSYRYLAKIINYAEYIIYMLNQTYVKRGVKRVPEEIVKMKILPDGFLKIYLDIVMCNSLKQIANKVADLVVVFDNFFRKNGIKYTFVKEKVEKLNQDKKEIAARDLIGSYEEIYSNWKNKMAHAKDINSSYLSFMTMASCQDFYDEMFDIYNIPKIELISKYNPNNLVGNSVNFNDALLEWKKLYDTHHLDIVEYKDLDDLAKNF